jgi:2-haloacid dehalogenase
MTALSALVFDAYGTLFDVHSVIAAAEQAFPGQGDALSWLWRSKQLEYSWLRSLTGSYEDFWKITQDALVFACRSMGLVCDQAFQERLLGEYLRLNAFPEVVSALDRLSTITLAVLSNGSPVMLQRVIAHAGLDKYFSHIWSVDEVGVYKPSPRVYDLAVKKLGIPAYRVGFVTSNFFDVAGAKAYGMYVYWVNRSRAPADELGIAPDEVIYSLTEIKRFEQSSV